MILPTSHAQYVIECTEWLNIYAEKIKTIVDSSLGKSEDVWPKTLRIEGGMQLTKTHLAHSNEMVLKVLKDNVPVARYTK